MPIECTPGRALMSENVRLVKVKDVDHVGIAQRLEKEQVVVVIPTCARSKNSICWCCLPDRRRQLGPHTVPTVRVVHLRLVEDFEEHALRVVG